MPVREAGGQYVALLEHAREAGYYTARVSVQDAGLPIPVNVDPRESRVACLGESELRANLEGIGLRVASSNDELAAAIESSRTGRSAWRVFMIAALAFLLIECLLAERMRSRGRASDTQPANPAPEHA